MSHDNTMEIHYPNCPVPLLIDIDDYDNLKKQAYFPKITKTNIYLVRTIGVNLTRIFSFARDILDFEGGAVDHINGNTMDNRRSNLRICSRLQNSYNRQKRWLGTSSKFKGVSKRKTGMWQARIGINYKRKTLGSFKTEEEAAKAYDKAAKELFGEFACLNFKS